MGANRINSVYGYLLIVLLVIFTLLILILTIKNKSNFVYILKHYLLFLFEIIISTMLINLLIGGFQEESVLGFFKDFLFSYSVYQLILMTLFKLKDSTEIDEINSIKNYIDYLLLHLEFEKEVPKQIREIAEEASECCRNKKQIKKWARVFEMEEMHRGDLLSDNDFRFRLKGLIIEIEHEAKIINFFWMNSIILRMIK